MFKSLKKELIEDFVLDKKSGKFAFVVRTADNWGGAEENEMELKEDDELNMRTPVAQDVVKMLDKAMPF
jgi:hypothetical protein